jgi:ribosomal protein S16
VVKIQTDELDAWVAKGAQVSPTVRSLVKKSRARAAAAGAS